jgi:hypothetical protein
VARRAFIRIKDLKYLELISEFQVRNCNWSYYGMKIMWLFYGVTFR